MWHISWKNNHVAEIFLAMCLPRVKVFNYYEILNDILKLLLNLSNETNKCTLLIKKKNYK
jgi:hypothetical protein